MSSIIITNRITISGSFFHVTTPLLKKWQTTNTCISPTKYNKENLKKQEKTHSRYPKIDIIAIYQQYLV